MSNPRYASIIDRFDQVIKDSEDTTISRINRALAVSYSNLEETLVRKYQALQANGSLLAVQRSTLLLAEIKELLAIVNPDNSGRIQQEFEKLLETQSQQGIKLSEQLIAATDGKNFVASTATVPIEAVKIAAEDSTKRLQRWGTEFADKATAAVEQGLIQGWGAQRTATVIRQQLGVTKTRAETITRTASLTATNEATKLSFKKNGINYSQWIATADDRTCPYCLARNMRVYRLEDIIIPGHPRCRCYQMPWKKEWADAGLLDEEWATDFYEKARQEYSGDLNFGLTAFEKAAGLKQPPDAIWTPQQGYIGLKPLQLPVTDQANYKDLTNLGQLLTERIGKDLTADDMQELLQSLVSNGLSADDARAMAEKVDITADGQIEKILIYFNQLTGGAAESVRRIESSADRAYALPTQGIINIGSNPDLLSLRELLLHELAHHLEYSNPAIAKAAKDWLYARATGSPQELRDVTGRSYADGEIALPDEFIHEYTGRLYDGDLTEVVSTGLQHFATPEAMLQLYQTDPEHFYLTVGILKSLQQGRQSEMPRIDAGGGDGEQLFYLVDNALTREQITARVQGTEDGVGRVEKLLEEISRTKLLKLGGKGAWNATVRELRKQFADDPLALDVIDSLGLDRGVSRKAFVRENLQELKRILDPEQQVSDQEISRRIKLNLYAEKPQALKLDNDDLIESLILENLNEQQLKGLETVRNYRGILKEVNGLLEDVSSVELLESEEYKQKYDRINELFGQLRSTVDEAKGAKKTGQSEIDTLLEQVSSVSKEALPGFEIRVPDSLEPIKERAAIGTGTSFESADLNELAEGHITAQKAVIQGLRTRLSELEAERADLLSEPQPDDDRLKIVQDSIKHLRLELNGEVQLPDGSFEKNPSKKSAEERAEVMFELYRTREQFVFNDTTKTEGKERTASLFGLPTINKMLEEGQVDIANDMIVRSTSLVLTRNDNRNPVDYVDTTGLEVKRALANILEHHQVYNNVYVNEQGRVQFKSFKLYQDKNSGELTLNIVPSYWNAEEHGRNTQFIGLMDAMHAGEDPIAHLHYYKFNEQEVGLIEEKIRADIPGIVQDAQKRAEKLQDKVDELWSIRDEPVRYEEDLKTRLEESKQRLEELKPSVKGFASKPKNQLNEEQLAAREVFDGQKKEINQLEKKLTEFQEVQNVRRDIEEGEKAIGDLQSRIDEIKLSKIPKGEQREAARLERNNLDDEIKLLKNDLIKQKKLLKDKGDIDQQISDVESKLGEAKQLADLDDAKVLELFNKTNGFFSFDKGSVEKDDHTVYRPWMNEEIHRYYVREALKYLQKEHGEDALAVLQEISKSQFQKNLYQRLSALMDKVRGKTF